MFIFMFIWVLKKYAFVVRAVSYCPHLCHPACVCLSIDLYAYLHVAMASMLIYMYVYATTVCSMCAWAWEPVGICPPRVLYGTFYPL